MKHFHPEWAVTYVLAALIGLGLGSLAYPYVLDAGLRICAAVGLR